jgi:uncharacterized protein DUF4124
VIRAGVILALALATPLAHAMYKWVDEKGVTHYSETPPADGKAEKIEIKPAVPAAAGKAAPETWKQRDLDSRQKRIERDHQEEEGLAKAKRDSAARQDQCRRARRELSVLETQVPVYALNEKKEKVYITDEERAREIADWKKLIQENCE